MLRGGAVFTLDADNRRVEALAIRDGVIAAVGSDGEIAPWVADSTRVVELEGRMVLPGFQDSHVHPASGGVELAECDLNGLPGRQEVLDKIAACAASDPEQPWIRGGGWDLPIFKDGNPGRAELDGVTGGRPAYLSSSDGHSAWVNTKALEVAGVTAATPDPPRGRLERDASGNPSGTLRESAMGLVAKHLPPYTLEDYEAGIARALEMANRFGITTLQEASGGGEMLEAYARLRDQGRLTARVVFSQHVDPERGPEQIAEMIERRDRFEGGRLKASTAKIFVDGVIEGHTAALLEPYLDRPGWRGEPNLEAGKLDEMVAALDREGFQVHLHAIGDRAIRMALDACEAAAKLNGPRDRRHHIAHLQLIDPADIPRFEKLGVVANFQPLWAYADSYITDLTEPVLGPERSRWLYPIRSVYDTGARMAAGSDWSVSSMNPLDAIQVAVTRKSLKGSEPSAWIPEERMELEPMLRAYTGGGAYVNRLEDRTGSLERGKAADLIVLDRNLFEVPRGEIHQVRVLWTLLEGKTVFGGL